MRILIACSVFFFFTSCEIDSFTNPAQESPTETNNLESQLEVYLSSQIAEIHEENVAGVCHFSSNRPNQITIDLSFWERASDFDKEMVVFHEIGHCVLGQGHRETEDANGNCLSIMRSGTGDCRTLYNSNNRDYYINELLFFND